MEKILIYGNGTVAGIAFFYLKKDSGFKVEAFTVDKQVIKEELLFGLPVIPFDEVESVYSPPDYAMMICVGYAGMNTLRAERYCQARGKGYRLITYINPKAFITSEFSIGDNCFIGANTVIHPFVRIGNDVIIRDNCFIGHHTVIGDHCYIGGGVAISGNCTIGSHCFLGTNSTFKDGIEIGNTCLIGAGVTMLHDTGEQEVYISTSAQKLPMTSSELQMLY